MIPEAVRRQRPWDKLMVRGRAGYAVGSSLFYATGGFAYGEVDTRIADLNPILTAGVTNDFSHTRAGWTAGAGIEHAFTWLGPNWTAKAEYLYVDLGSMTDSYSDGFETRIFTTHAQDHVFRSGLNYRFY
jgi:outer membrane immunogenic protein